MKIKMVKMGSDYTTPINCRLRGIVVTPDNKHLFVEVGCAYSPDIKHTSLTQKEYNLKYCPECGKKLLKKNGPYGNFLGCSGFRKNKPGACDFHSGIDKFLNHLNESRQG